MASDRRSASSTSTSSAVCRRPTRPSGRSPMVGFGDVEALEQAEVHRVDVLPHLGHPRPQASEHVGGVAAGEEQRAGVVVLAEGLERRPHLRRHHARHRRVAVEDRQERRRRSTGPRRRPAAGSHPPARARARCAGGAGTPSRSRGRCTPRCAPAAARRRARAGRRRARDGGRPTPASARRPSDASRRARCASSKACAATPARRPNSAPIHSGSLGPSGPGRSKGCGWW